VWAVACAGRGCGWVESLWLSRLWLGLLWELPFSAASLYIRISMTPAPSGPSCSGVSVQVAFERVVMRAVTRPNPTHACKSDEDLLDTERYCSNATITNANQQPPKRKPPSNNQPPGHIRPKSNLSVFRVHDELCHLRYGLLGCLGIFQLASQLLTSFPVALPVHQGGDAAHCEAGVRPAWSSVCVCMGRVALGLAPRSAARRSHTLALHPLRSRAAPPPCTHPHPQYPPAGVRRVALPHRPLPHPHLQQRGPPVLHRPPDRRQRPHAVGAPGQAGVGVGVGGEDDVAGGGEVFEPLGLVFVSRGVCGVGWGCGGV